MFSYGQRLWAGRGSERVKKLLENVVRDHEIMIMSVKMCDITNTHTQKTITTHNGSLQTFYIFSIINFRITTKNAVISC